MKLLIDINHPAHVHYFQNLISLLKEKGISSTVIARKDETIISLLEYHKIDFLVRNSRPKKLIFKPFYLLFATLFNIRQSFKVKPDLFIGFASFPVAFCSYLLNRPSIILDDTEHNRLNHALYERFAKLIITPTCFKKKFSTKQVFVDSFMELSYLHRDYFELTKGSKSTKYFISRKILFDATHDYNVDSSSTRWKVDYVSSKLQSTFERIEANEGVRAKFHPAEIHQFLANAKCYIGEGATMAAESACLGVPAIYSNNLKVGYLEELKSKYSILFDLDECKTEEELDKLIDHVLSFGSEDRLIIRNKICDQKVDITRLLVWLILDFDNAKKLKQTKIIDKEFFDIHKIANMPS